MGRLEKIVGVEIIDDVRLGHTFYETDVLLSFLLDERPVNFFEVGIHEGGLTYVLLPKLPWSVYYTGIEIHCDLIRPVVRAIYYKNPHAQLICMDCFDPIIFSLMSVALRKVIYCDGGNKAKEISYFKDACAVGDVIMCHDYWDGTRKVRDVPDEYISKEVLPKDVQIFENDTAFQRLPEEIFKETRIIGWRKVDGVSI